jgi:hypothetical protein
MISLNIYIYILRLACTKKYQRRNVIWQPSPDFRRCLAAIAGFRTVWSKSDKVAEFRHEFLDSSDGCQNSANATGFQQSDTKIWESSTVELGYQQTPVLSSDKFLQKFVQE